MNEQEKKEYNELINQVVILATRNITKKSIKKFVENKKDKIDKIAKKQFIKKIKEAEIFAKKTKKITIKQDLFELKNKMINDNHYTLLLNEYHTNNIKSYNNITNLYKVLNKQFYYLYSKTKKELTDNDRFDFIATILLDYLDKKPDTIKKLKEREEALNQLKDIDNIVYETYLAELKNEYSKKYLNKIQTKKEPQKIKLSIKQVALKYIYEGKHITRQNSNSIIKEYGHTSGDKLYNEYTRYSSKTNRIANEETEQKLKNKIKLIESVISLLSIENQEKPKKEITDLKAKLTID
ncbi:hypothetical protein TNO021_430098 [Tenacibaculum dicentrarchi]|nr:hypothetical protein TNO021_430098 [Tenacibaculum dicentrarchi]